LEHFGAWTSHGQTQTHHGLYLGEATTFHLIIYSLHGHGVNTQMSFCLGTLGIPKVGTLATLGAHNFVCKPLIEVRSKAKLYPFSRAFQQFVARHLHATKSGQFRPFFWP